MAANAAAAGKDKMLKLVSDDKEDFEVIEYCKKHVEVRHKASDDALKAFDAQFVDVDKNTLFELALAASYLNIKGLLGLTCQTIADMIKGKTPEEARKILNTKNDFTPEEEQKQRQKCSWAFVNL
nr:unnamed protein product [Digitaria exilis]